MNSLNIGVSGLLAFQRSLDVTSHNISNVATDGYSRQRAELTPANAQFLSGSYYGSGVQVSTVQRAYDRFATTELWGQTAAQKSLQTVADLSTRLGAPLSDASSSLQGALSDYYAALRTVAAAPQDASARQAALSGMQTLASRVHILDGALGSLEQEVNGRIGATVTQISALAGQVADVNRRIAAAGTAPPNDLLDARDRLLGQLASKIAVQTVPQADGTVNVMVGTGQALVNGAQAYTLSVGGGPYDAVRPEVYFTGSSGTGAVTEQMTGGELGGLLDFRRQVLDPARAAVGRVVAGVAITANDQHRLGLDATGQLGGDLWTDLSGAPRVLPAAGNSGDGKVNATISDLAGLTDSRYRLARDAGGYSLTRLADGKVFTLSGFPGTPETVDGVTLSLASGALNVGDSYLIDPTGDAARQFDLVVSDPARLALAGPVRSAAALTNTGSGRIGTPGAVSASGDLLQAVTITFTSATTFDVTDKNGNALASGVAYDPASGATLEYNGWSVRLEGAPAAGDTFRIEPNTGGSGDGRNAQALAGQESALALEGGRASALTSYAGLLARVGSAGQQARIGAEARQALVDQAQAAREAVSGVNLDEEAANLVQLQQAYQAAAQVISISASLFTSLLNAVSS
ncbi:flagellar hook-associated protein FlgK [Immundisolibacter sp.]|uniref:flagellar hook-associated protein FlgK n=1 Tax=Immundisolibacter sp. TaxID=1934948 RepID=UPI002606E076|nr:flagellar hook-associated protein FlgK [Immundisolibacter sp.]MDD3651023.1 flagellar hook-associated protein FlgK [Immundisolibacter sp.]